MPKYRHFNWFERAWNSTLGLPEQLIRRAWRVASTDAQFFSEEGFLDASLIPVFGSMDTKRKDVSDEEFLEGFLNEDLGMNVDPEGFAPALITSLLTDPLSYLTGGATIAAKQAQALNRVKRSKALGAAKITDDMTIDQARSLAKNQLKDSKNGDLKSRSQLHKQLRQLEEADGNELVGSLVKKENDRALMVALPFLERYDSARMLTLSPEKQSWMRLTWDAATKNTGAKAVGAAASSLVELGKKVPGLGHTLHFMADTVHANSLAKRSLGLRSKVQKGKGLMTKQGQALAELIEEYGQPYKRFVEDKPAEHVVRRFEKSVNGANRHSQLAKEARKRAENLTGDAKKKAVKAANRHQKVADKYAKMSPEELLLHAMGEKYIKGDKAAIKARADTLWRQLTRGNANIPMPTNAEDLRSVLLGENGYVETIGGAVDKLTQVGVKRELDTRVFDIDKELKGMKKFHQEVFKLSRNARKAVRKLFRTDFKSGELAFLESERQLRRDVGRMTTAVQERAKVLLPLMRKGAEQLGMKTEQFDTMILSFFEGAASEFEVEELYRLASQEGGIGGEKFVAAADRYINRAAESMKRVEDILRQNGHDELADQVERVGMKSVLERGVVGKYEKSSRRRVRPAEATRPTLRATAHENAHAPDGIQLGYKTLDELQALRRQQEARFEEGLTQARKLQAVKKVLSDDKIAKLSGKSLAKELKDAGIDITKGTAAENKKLLREEMAKRRAEKAKIKQRIAELDAEIPEREALTDDIDAVILMREKGTGPHKWEPPKVKDPEVGARPLANDPQGEFVSEAADSFGAFASDEDLELAYARLVTDIAEAKRMGPNATPEQLTRIQYGLRNYGEWVSRAMLKGFGEDVGESVALTAMKTDAGKAFAVIRGMQEEVLRAGVKSGVVSAGSPLAYIGRFLGPGQRTMLKEAIENIPYEVQTKVLPQLSTGFARNADTMSLHELNDLAVALQDLAPDAAYTKQLRELAEQAMGETPTKYTESAGLSILASFAQAQQRSTTADFLDSMIEEGIENGAQRMEGFKVVGVIDTTQGQVIPEGVRRKTTTRKEVDGGEEVTIATETEDIKVGTSGIVIQDSKGNEFFVDFRQLENGTSILPLGERGNTLGESFALGVTDGSLEDLQKKWFNKGVMDAESAEALKGQRILLGNEELIGETVRLARDQFKAAGYWGHAYDAVHTQLKAFQTAYRPDFHIANLSSSVFQMAMSDGVGSLQIGGGFLDMMRFMFGDNVDITDSLDMAAELLDDTKGVTKRLARGARFAERVRRRGTLGGVKSRFAETDEFAERMFFEFGDERIAIEDIFDVMDKEGLLGTFVQEGLRGRSSIPDTLTKLRKAAFEGKEETLVGKGATATREFAELSETAARVMSVFAHMRGGYSLETAVKKTRDAMVDYANTTRFEKNFVKRISSFYTFPRQYIPHAIKQFDGDPSKLATLSSVVQAGLTSESFSIENGRVVIDPKWAGGRQLTAGRMAAPLDAMMFMPQLLASAGVMAPGILPGEQAPRQALLMEGVPGVLQASAMFDPGGMWDMTTTMLQDSRPGSPTKLDAVARLTPVSRWLSTRLGGDPWIGDVDVPRGLGEEVLFRILPYSQKAPNHDLKTLQSNLLRTQSYIRRKMQDAAKQGNKSKVEKWKNVLLEVNDTALALKSREQ